VGGAVILVPVGGDQVNQGVGAAARQACLRRLGSNLNPGRIILKVIGRPTPRPDLPGAVQQHQVRTIVRPRTVTGKFRVGSYEAS
jgi:hypothetical protein